MSIKRLRLNISDSVIYADRNKLLIRLSEIHKNTLGIQNYDFVNITNSQNKKIIASVQFSQYLSEHYADITQDLAVNLGLKGGDSLEITTIAELPEIKQVKFAILKKQKELYTPNLCEKLAKPTENSLEVLLNEEIGTFIETSEPAHLHVLLPLLLYKPIIHGYIVEYNDLIYISNIKMQTEGLITRNTVFRLLEKIEQKVDEAFKSVGGLEDEVAKLKQIITLPFEYPELFEKMNIQPIKGVLLYGPPGTGKTMLAKAIAKAANASFYTINGPEVVAKFYGESEKNIRNIFDKAKQSAPSIIFIDEIDSIAPKRADTVGDVEKRIVATLLTLMDGLQSRGKVVVIGATNLIDNIDPALRRGGRFDLEMQIKPPTSEGRLHILKIMTKKMPLKDVDLTQLANEHTNGFVGADLSVLCKEACIKSIERYVADEKNGRTPTLFVSMADFTECANKIEPSALREYSIEKPNVKWSHIKGLDTVIENIKDELVLPQTYASVYEKSGFKPPKGLLLYGPPGTGKTMLAKAVANELNYNLISLKGPELLTKWVGETEQKIRKVFTTAKQSAPTIIFIDEIDSLATHRSSSGDSGLRDSIIGQFLTELDGMNELKHVILLATTNRPDLIDPALLRAGRFDKKIEVPYPNADSLCQIIQHYNQKLNFELTKEQLSIYATRGAAAKLTGADIHNVGRIAIKNSIKKNSFAETGELLLDSTCYERAFQEVIKDKTEKLKPQNLKSTYGI